MVLNHPIIDVRSPAEFEQGHIPKASNIPLFSDEERHQVGKCFKQKGKDAAVKLGLKYVGPKLEFFVTEAQRLCPEKVLTMYCWRGGMRSASMSWLLRTAGFSVELIPGGYKSWRRHIHSIFESKLNFITLSGFTGSGKTDILHALSQLGEQVVDLEGLANHKGSAFGFIEHQPTTEQFENLLGERLRMLDLNHLIWVEDESKTIGKVFIPLAFRTQMRQAPLLRVHAPLERRITSLCRDYGNIETDYLKHGFLKIKKQIGGQNSRAAIEFLEQGNLAAACEIALAYYDKSYLYSLEKSQRATLFNLDISNQSYQESAKALIQWKNQNLPCLVMDRAVDAK